MILAIDPGKTTGYAYQHGEAHGSGQLVLQDALWGLLDALAPTVIVCERFDHRMVMGADLEAVEVIGILKEWSRQNRVEVHFQTQEQAKHFFTNARLKERGMDRPGLPHARDAARHLLYWLTFGGGKPSGGRRPTARPQVPETVTEPAKGSPSAREGE